MPGRLVPSPDALATRVGDEIVLVHTVTDKIFVLNRTGARVWELLAGAADRAEIERTLADEFDAAGAPVGDEVRALIDALVDGRLVTERADG